jgi:chitinase
MSKKIVLLFVFIIGVFALTSCQQLVQSEELDASATNLWVSGYYVGYINYPVSEIDFSGITHLMIGPILPKSDTTLEVSMFTANGPQLARSAVQATHAKGKKAIAFIGGMDTAPDWRAASTGANRARFVANLKKLITDYRFDGLDLDWEPVAETDKPLLLALVKDLRAALPNAVLTFPAGGALNTNFPEDLSFYKQLAPYLNQLNLMSYGVAGAYPDGTPYEGWLSWHNGPLYNPKTDDYRRTPTSIDDAVLAYLAAGVPANKLGIGIGFYGNCWTAPVTRPRQEPNGAKLVASDNDMSYANIIRDYYMTSAARWDSGAKVPYLTYAQPRGPKGCAFISYENGSSIKYKGDYVKAKGLGGTILWNINEGYISGNPVGQKNPLMAATRKAFLE